MHCRARVARPPHLPPPPFPIQLSLDDGPNMFYVFLDDAGRVYIAITSKGYPSRYIYGTPDGGTRGILSGAWRRQRGGA